jgi:hypothetical protein
MGFLQPPQINWSQDDLNFLQGASDFNGVWEPGEFNWPLPDMEPDLRNEAVAGDFLFWSRNLDNMLSDKKRMTIQALVDLVSDALVIPSWLPDGWTTWQALIKASNDDQDVEWWDMPEWFSGVYGDLTGVPSTFAPSSHTHPFWEITGLTKGSVLFGGPTGIPAQDNQNFFFDDEWDSFFVSSTLGSEIILNGIFSSWASWTAPSGWTIASWVATHGSNGTWALTPSTAITIYAGMRYTITVDIGSLTAGTGTITVGGVTIAVASASGTYTKTFVALATTNLAITPSNTARFTVDNVSLKQLSWGKISSGNFYGEFFQATMTGLGATTSPGSVLDNPTPATAWVQQASPSNLLRWRWYNSSGSASWPFEIQDYAIGNVNITAHGKWIQQWRGNSGTWAEFCSFDSDPLGKWFNLTPGQSHSNGGPGTTRVLTLSNSGTNTWIDFLFSGVRKSHIGADSNGAMKFYAGGWNYFEYYQMASGSLFSYNYPSAFYHSGNLQAAGHGMFGGKVGAGTGSWTTPTSTLTVNGGEAKKTRRVTSNITLDDTAYFWIADATNPSCNGTPSVTTCSTYTGSGQATCESHLPCSWYAGSSCSGFSYESGMGTCTGTSGCSADTAACSGGDQSTCEANDDAYGGSCAWSETDCWGLDESTCGSYSGSGCSQNYSDCSTFNGNDSGCTGQSGCSSSGNTCPSQMDEWSCTWAGCSWDGMTCTGDNSTCSGTYFTGCSGTYYTCTGTYYTGNCSGTYGASCNGTVTCTGYSSSGACTAETGCSWSTAITLTLPDSATLPNYSCAIYNGSSTGADVNIVAPSWHTTDVSLLSAHKDSVILQGFNDARACSDFTSAGACTPTGCTANYNSCSWESMDNTCYGDASCSAANGTDSMTCNAISYFSSCSGTWYASKHYYRLAS